MLEKAGKDWRAGLLVALLAFLVYANSLGNGFTWDDKSVILLNPLLRGTPLALFSSIDTTSDAQLLPYYRPLTLLTFLIEEQVHGLTPFAVRLFNVLLHAANAFLVYCLARLLIGDTFAALLAGLLFAVHPLNAEGVDYNAGGRNTLLSCFFILAAYLLYCKSVEKEKVSIALAGALFFLAGLFSKETALMILPFIVAAEIIHFRAPPTGTGLRAAGRLAPYVMGMAAYLLMRWITLSALGIQSGIIPGLSSQTFQSIYLIPSLRERLLDNLYIIPRYLLNVVWPTTLSPRYIVPEDLHLLALPLIVAWLCIGIALGWLVTRGRSRATVFGLFWFIAFWLPVSGIVYFPSAPMADRFMYVPAIGLWIIIADQTARLFSSGYASRRYVMLTAALVLVTLAVLTTVRNADWKSDISLFSRLVEMYPDNPYGHAYLGMGFYAESKRDNRYIDLAEQEFGKAMNVANIYQMEYALTVHIQMGHIRRLRGDYEGALYHYTEALAIYPSDREARLNRGITLENLGRYREAVNDYELLLATPGLSYLEGARSYAEERLRELSKLPGI